MYYLFVCGIGMVCLEDYGDGFEQVWDCCDEVGLGIGEFECFDDLWQLELYVIQCVDEVEIDQVECDYFG